MRLDDLVKAYEVAFYGAANGPADKTNFRAGIRAVVEALRDKVARSDYPLRTINEILASDGVEAPAIRAAAGGGE